MSAARPPFVRLSVMMFLQYATWGAWLPLLFPFLGGHRGFDPIQIATMFSVGAVGAIVAPFVAGQLADRRVATEKFLGVSHLLGAVLVWQLATIESFGGFLAFSLAYSLIYAPTLPLTNSLAFHHLTDRDAQFGRVRVWGTIGWVCAGIAIGQWLLRQHTPDAADASVVLAAQRAGMADAFRLSALLGAAMGIFCFCLPRTPPSPVIGGRERFAPLEALGEVKRQPLATLFLLAVPMCCIHQFYFVHTADFLGRFQSETATALNEIFGVGGAGLMTIGQMSEIAVIAALPLVAKRVSRKSLLAVGIAAYALRMALFGHVGAHPEMGADALPLLIGGVLLHGLCFGCFIFVAFLIVDEQTTPDVRASAQSLFNVVFVGIGVIAGSYFAGAVADWSTTVSAGGAKSMDYGRLFAVPMWGALACLVLLLVFYPGGPRRAHVGVAT